MSDRGAARLLVTVMLAAALPVGDGSTQAIGQQPATSAVAIDVDALGPQVGARVPDFTLTDQAGRSRTLTSLMGPKGLVLVFFRSADW